MAQTIRPTQTATTSKNGQRDARILHDDGRDDQGHQVHDLDHRVQRRAGRIFQRVADGIADNGRLVIFAVLAAVVAVFDILLGVVPGPAGVGHEHRLQQAGENDAGQEAAQRLFLQQQAHGDRRQDGDQAQRNQFRLRRSGRNGDRLLHNRASASHP